MILIDIVENNIINSKCNNRNNKIDNSILQCYCGNIKDTNIKYMHINILKDKFKIVFNSCQSELKVKDKIKDSIVISYYTIVFNNNIKKIVNNIINEKIYITKNDINNIYIVLAKSLKDSNKKYSEILLSNILKQLIKIVQKGKEKGVKFSINHINEINTKFNNSIKYLADFNHIKSIVIITEENLTKTFIIDYIAKFKTFDIVIDDRFNAGDKEKLKKIVHDINLEYGTTIKVLTDIVDLQYYDIVLINVSSNITRYIFKKSSYILNLKNSSNDIYSDEYKIFTKYKDKINYRVNLNHFNIIDIGQAFLRT